MTRNSKGFSLIELLIVVAIILIIAAIAIPDLLKSRVAANQASAVGSLRTINTSEVTYSSTYTSGYSPTLVSLDGPAGGNSAASSSLIDSVLGAGVKSQYTFLYTAVQTSASPVRYDAYSIGANPVQGAGTGNGNCYYSDASAVIRFNTATTATSSDSPLAG
ncbi:MAG: pili assembly chaperone [Acidobacteria bacterium]|nr:MAG: pili assembly chaperone [Acidobacteriota bacterium]